MRAVGAGWAPRRAFTPYQSRSSPRGVKCRGATDEATDAADALWALVQSSQAFRSTPRASLYNDRATKEAVRLAVGGSLETGLVPRTMLALAYIGGSAVWEEEMDSLLEQLKGRVGSVGSLRAVQDVGRALRRCRHQGDGELMVSLDARARALLEAGGTYGPGLMAAAAAIAGDIAYAGVVPERLLGWISEQFLDGGGREQGGVDRGLSMQCLRDACWAVVCADRVLAWQGPIQQRLVAALAAHIAATVLPTLASSSYSSSSSSYSYSSSSSSSMAPLTRLDRDIAGLHAFLLAYAPKDDPVLRSATQRRQALRRHHTVSTFQREVYDVLRGHLGVTCEMEGDVQGVSVDIILARQGLAIECNGPSHYYRNAVGLVPASRLKTALAEEAGWRLVHVDQRVWDDLPSREAKGAWVTALIGHS